MSRITSDSFAPIVRSLCERIDSPRSLAVWLCFQHAPEELLELPMPQAPLKTTSEWAWDYFITEYLQKYKGLKTSYDLEARALEKWKLSEAQCRETNRRFREPSLPSFTGREHEIISIATRKISAVLGVLRVPLILRDCAWGPGATTDVSRRDANPAKKISEPASVTPAALPYFRAVVESDPHWFAALTGVVPDGPFRILPSAVKLVRGSRFLTVAKNAKINRCIAAEPTGNGFLQQGVHTYLVRRLLRFGVDLTDQTINQRRAREAYDAGFATLDLSMASDTISRELIFHLLPIDWALFLDSIRSPETLVRGDWVRTEKFASMGNAFCFELETLIFWSLAEAVCQSRGFVDSVTVFGDDIIVPCDCAHEVSDILKLCGFAVNATKSHIWSDFYESCGKHYYRGVDVTPVYQKEMVTHPSEVIRAHNRLARLASRLGSNHGNSVVTRARGLLRDLYPHRPLPLIPMGLQDDGGFLHDASRLHYDANHGYRCHVLDYIPNFSGVNESGAYAYKLRRFGQSNPVVEDRVLDQSSAPPFRHKRRREGYAGTEVAGRWRTRVRWVPASALTGSPGNDWLPS